MTDRKTIELMVAVTVEVPTDCDPNAVTFDIPVETMDVYIDGKFSRSSKVIGYGTQEYPE